MNKESIIIIVTYNSQDFIEKCLRSILIQNYKEWFLIVVDNASTDNTAAVVREFRNMYPEISPANFKLIVLKKNNGFAGAVNYAVFNFLNIKKKDLEKHAEFLVLLNPDVCMNRDSLKKMISLYKKTNQEKIKDSRIGAAGGLILDYKKDTIQHMGGKVSSNFITSHINCGRNYSEFKKELNSQKKRRKNLNSVNGITDVDYATGAFFVTEFKLFKDMGGFDTGYRPAYFEELDYCLKLKKIGRRVVVNPFSVARHFEGASVKKFSRNFYKFYHKNRIRCAVVNLGFFGFLKSFIGTEVRWAGKKATRDQFLPLFYAYFLNLLFLPYNLIIKLKNYLILNKLELK